MTITGVLVRLESVRPCVGGYIAHCPAHHDRCPSLSIREGEDGRLLLHCFAGCTWKSILAAIGNGLIVPHAPLLHPPRPELTDPKRIEIARRIWRGTRPATGTPVERYLRLRRITSLPPSIRFAMDRHALSQTGPQAIMIVAVQNLAGEIIAINRTFLTGDGRKAPVEPVKMAFGPIRGGAVRLASAGETLALAEGIETALSVQQATAIPTWATLGTANLQRVELPAIVREVVICADADRNGAGERAAQAAAQVFLRNGSRVRIVRPPAGSDFNDVLTGRSR